MGISFILIFIAIVLFVMASAGVPGRIGWGWAGMACFALAQIV